MKCGNISRPKADDISIVRVYSVYSTSCESRSHPHSRFPYANSVLLTPLLLMILLLCLFHLLLPQVVRTMVFVLTPISLLAFFVTVVCLFTGAVFCSSSFLDVSCATCRVMANHHILNTFHSRISIHSISMLDFDSFGLF